MIRASSRRRDGLRTTRRAALVAIVLVLTAACSRVPHGGETLGLGEPGAEFGGQPPSDVGEGAGGPFATAGRGPARSTGPGPGTLSSAAPRLGSVPAAGSATQGIDRVKRTIKLAYAWKLERCGPDAQTAGNRVGNAKGLEILEEYVKFFNTVVLAPYRWKVTVQVVDDGGAECPEKQRAAALRIIKEIKPFAVLGGFQSQREGPILADAVTRAGIIHIGPSWATYDEFRKRQPYAWDVFGIPQRAYEALTAFMGKRIKQTSYRNRTSGLDAPRVYGMLATDLPEVHNLTRIVRAQLAQYGINMAPNHVYFTSAEPSVSAQQAIAVVSKMKADGVNTLIFDLLSGANASEAHTVYTSTMAAQDFRPDIMVGVYGSPFFERLFEPSVWQPKGTSLLPIITLRLGVRVDPQTGQIVNDPRFDEINENQWGWQKVWERAGHNDFAQDSSLPQAFDSWSYLSLLAQGVMHAGPTLDLGSWVAGVNASRLGGPNHCGVERLMGRDYIHERAFDWDTDHDGGGQGATTIYWVNKRTPFGTDGYYESYDNYRYFRSAADLPARPSHDTGAKGYAVTKQPRIGLRPWVTCASLGLKD